MDASLLPHYGNTWNIGVLYGPHGAPDFFSEESIEEFFAAEWEVHYNSNRLGVRLSGPKPKWTRADGGEAGLHPSNVHDCEYAIGSINFTGDFPVILTKDGPSLGGFVCPVTIAKAELWKVGQVKPGDKLRFHPISFKQAQSLEQAQLGSIEALAAISAVTLPVPSLEPSNTLSATVLAELPAEDGRPRAVYRQAGDAYILLEYGDNLLDLALRLRVHLLMEALKADPLPGLEELAPGVRSLQLRYDSRVLHQQTLLDHLLRLERGLGDVANLKVPTRIVHLPMAFEDSATLGAVTRYRETVRAEAPWLPNNVDFLQRINGLDRREQVSEIIFDASYLILGLGDVYLDAPCAVPLDPRHRLLSSKYNPARTYTAEGTVGIGGMYMCIYGMDSPGGYQLVGRTLPIWNKFVKSAQFRDGQPWLLHFFDQVRFYPVSEAELDEFREAFREGRAQIRIEETEFDFAEYRRFLADNSDDIAAFQTRQKAAFDAEAQLWKDDDPAKAAPLAVEADDEQELDGHHMVSADMCGSVWKVLVEPGQQVEAGAPLLVVEAMKMELAVIAPVSGTVQSVRCQPGKAVTPGDALLLLKPTEAA
ncbi:Glutaconyl-CoA decarboxylase subunit gamma [compost metagenome]